MQRRPRRWSVTVAVGVALAAAGCGGRSEPDSGVDAGADAGVDAGCSGPTAGDYPPQVVAVLGARCMPCHGSPPANRAPFSLANYEDSQAPYGFTGLRRWQRMAEVIEDGGLPHMPPVDAGQLSTGDFDALRAWFAACAPGLPEDGGDPGEHDGGP